MSGEIDGYRDTFFGERQDGTCSLNNLDDTYSEQLYLNYTQGPQFNMCMCIDIIS